MDVFDFSRFIDEMFDYEPVLEKKECLQASGTAFAMVREVCRRRTSDNSLYGRLNSGKIASLTDAGVFEYVQQVVEKYYVRPVLEGCLRKDGTVDFTPLKAFVEKYVPRVEFLDSIPMEAAEMRERVRKSHFASKPSAKQLYALDLNSCDPKVGRFACTFPLPDQASFPAAKNMVGWFNVERHRKGERRSKGERRKSSTYFFGGFVQSFVGTITVAMIAELVHESVRTMNEGGLDVGSSLLGDYLKSSLCEHMKVFSQNGRIILSHEVRDLPYAERWILESAPEVSFTDASFSFVANSGRSVHPATEKDLFLLWLIYGGITREAYVSRSETRLGRRSWSWTWEMFPEGSKDVILGHAVKILSSEHVLDEAQKRESERNAAARARSYEPLKTTSQAHAAAARSSSFNQYFGLVEYDPLTDLSLGDATISNENGERTRVYDHFSAIARTFGFKPHPEVALRFRRLGNHHCSGMYFHGESIRCIAVDPRHPTSFVHEYGHMLDYDGGDLSRQKNFRPLYDAYVALLRKALAEDHSRSCILKGKFGQSYYEEPTEVFARSFEMFALDCRIHNGLLQPPRELYAFAYPDDDHLHDLIRNYFEPLLGVSQERIEATA